MTIDIDSIALSVANDAAIFAKVSAFQRAHPQLKPYAKRIYNGLYPDEDFDVFELISFPYCQEDEESGMEMMIMVRKPDEPATMYAEWCDWLLNYTIPQKETSS